jgi:hypothetical protein
MVSTAENEYAWTMRKLAYIREHPHMTLQVAVMSSTTTFTHTANALWTAQMKTRGQRCKHAKEPLLGPRLQRHKLSVIPTSAHSKRQPFLGYVARHHHHSSAAAGFVAGRPRCPRRISTQITRKFRLSFMTTRNALNDSN